MKVKRPVTVHPVDPTLALVPLTKGAFAVISAVDMEAVGRFNWSVTTPGYAARGVWEPATKMVSPELLHRLVAERMGLDMSKDVDHANGNRLDCRRSNLREATPSQNQANKRMARNNRSGIKGVFWISSERLWRAVIDANGQRTIVGRFRTLPEAAAAIALARETLHGEFANHGSN